MPSARSTLLTILTAALSFGFSGCAGKSPADASDKKVTTTLQPSDFAGAPTGTATQAAPAPKTSATVSTSEPVTTPPAPRAPVSASPSSGDEEVERDLNRMIKPTITAAPPVPEGSYVVDAMVGQVNGQAIYATDALEPISAQLAALGARLPRAAFRDQARRLIIGRMDQIVADALILGEAERDLSEAEQMGLRNILREQREEFLRQFGQGSIAVADSTLMEREGRTLEQRMTAEREKILVQRYLRQKLLPKINVTRRDVERYYNDNIKEYRPEAGKIVRIIRVEGTANADRVDKQLSEGTAFAEVASSRINSYQRDRGGLMEGKIVGDNPFGPAALNEAFTTLKSGEHSQRIKVGSDFWWLYLESIESGKQRSLSEVQLEIEDILRRQRFQLLSTRYRERLFVEGTYNPIEQMGNALIQVALTRYALPE